MEKKPVKVKYPKLKKHIQENYKQFSTTEPVRRMLLDKVRENLKMIERVHHLHRVIYIGEHSSAPELASMIITTVNSVDDELNNADKLTGFLLVYQRFFLHMIEGSEDMINRHVGELLKKYGSNKELRNMKMLIQVSHVLKRLCPEWMSYYGFPPKLMTPLEEDVSMEETGRRLYNCVRQMYSLIAAFVKDNAERGEIVSEDSKESEKESRLSEKGSLTQGLYYGETTRSGSISSSLRGSRSNSFNQSNASGLGFAKDRYWIHLPEMEILDALIRSEYTPDIRVFYNKYMRVPQRDIYKDKVWPVPGDFIPFDVFSTPYECVTELRPRKDASKPDPNLHENDETAHDETEGASESLKEKR